MHSLLLLAFFSAGAFALDPYNVHICPINELFYEGECFQYSYMKSSWMDAQSACEKQDYRLLTIENEKMETQQTFQTKSAISWIGLRCYGNTPDSCFWGSLSKQKKLTADSYANFAQGHPNPKIGNCVKMDSATATQMYNIGSWLSADCNEQLYYTCARSAFMKTGAKN